MSETITFKEYINENVRIFDIQYRTHATEKLIAGFSLTDTEAEFFKLLVRFAHAKTEDLRTEPFRMLKACIRDLCDWGMATQDSSGSASCR